MTFFGKIVKCSALISALNSVTKKRKNKQKYKAIFLSMYYEKALEHI